MYAIRSYYVNLLVGWNCLQADRVRLPHPHWLKPLIYISIIWAFSIHTVTAFLYRITSYNVCYTKLLRLY